MKTKRNFLAAALVATGIGLGVAALATAQDRSEGDRPAERERDRDRADDTRRDEPRRDDRRLDVAADRYNDAIPPTLFGHFPTKGSLTFLGVAEVQNGRLGDTRLDGAKFGFFGRAGGDWKKGKKLEALSLYLDESAPAEQRRALGTIFRSEERFGTDARIPLAVVRIEVARAGTDPLAAVRVRIGDRGNFTVTPIAACSTTASP